MNLLKPLNGMAVSLTGALLLAALPAPLLAQDTNAAGTPDTLVVPEDQKVMDAAIAEARRTLPEFLAVLDRPHGAVRDISFKYPLEGWEHIWVANVTHRGNALEGDLDNDPEAQGHKIGEHVVVPLGQVSDWGYRGADGVMRGHRTTKVLLPQMDPDEAAQIRQWLGWKD